LQSTSFGTAKHSIVSFNAMSKGVTWSNMILLIPIHTLHFSNSIQFQNLPDFIFTSINMDPVHHKKQLQMKAYYRYICK
ncbi:hypothetical protein T4B_2023, partial [Trichinella pseudospiralis]